MIDDALALLTETTQNWGLNLTPNQLDQFTTYAQELKLWNAKANLTAITDDRNIVLRLFLDSLRLALSWAKPPQSLIDIGSGAGFPGLPLKLLYPQLKLVLVESVGKKIAFLEHIVQVLGLENVTLLQKRAETVGKQREYRERFEIATARGVAEICVLAEYCLPLVEIGGFVLLPKGSDISAEVEKAQSALTLLGGKLRNIEVVQLPELKPSSLVCIEKVASTPNGYPRPIGIPTNRPL
jgi:16S rRNA (guanine527-N7)-methyltransferase